MNEQTSPVTERDVQTPRLTMRVRCAGPDSGWPALFLHGNCSDSRFWSATLAALPAQFRAVAPDLRGFGATEGKPIDATRGMRDFTDDVHALVHHPEVFGGASADRKVLLVAHSAGAGVALQYTIDHPERVGALVLVAPMSPYGFGGTRDDSGTPCWPDYAGSGGGTANPDFVKRIAAGDRSDEEQSSPRAVLFSCFVKPTFHADPAEKERLLDSVLSTRIGDEHYPGDLATSENWPGVAPGTRGMNNAISPKFTRLGEFGDLAVRPPVLWVRGADDAIISDTSLFDLGYLGQLGAVPGWPGADAYPPQPMIGQTRALLERYRAGGGVVEEVVIPDCGHSPQVEQPAAFLERVVPFLTSCAE